MKLAEGRLRNTARWALSNGLNLPGLRPKKAKNLAFYLVKLTEYSNYVNYMLYFLFSREDYLILFWMIDDRFLYSDSNIFSVWKFKEEPFLITITGCMTNLNASLHKGMFPEIKRTSLDSLCMQILDMNLDVDLRNFPFIERPDTSALNEALESLKSQGVINGRNERLLTPLGMILAKLPVEIPISKVIINITVIGNICYHAFTDARLCLRTRSNRRGFNHRSRPIRPIAFHQPFIPGFGLHSRTTTSHFGLRRSIHSR